MHVYLLQLSKWGNHTEFDINPCMIVYALYYHNLPVTQSWNPRYKKRKVIRNAN